MKKLIVLILFLVLLNTLFASPIGGEERIYSIPVIYSPNVASRIEFSDEIVKYGIFSQSKKDVVFKASNNGKFITDTFFINYQIFDAIPIRITVKLDPLYLKSDENQDNVIHYKVSKNYYPIGADSANNAEVVVYDEVLEGIKTDEIRVGYFPVVLEANIDESRISNSGEYLGNIYLEVVSLEKENTN